MDDASRDEARVSPRRFWLVVGGAALAIALGCWLSSGTLAPYGTWDYGRCHYRVNGDHGQFEAVFRMLERRPHQQWDYSVVLRRILHPLLAYPLMKKLGFGAGGLIFNMLSHAAALIALALALRKYFDARAAMLTCWLLASWPGYAYWGGLPYAYAWIVPGSIACTIVLLWWHDAPSRGRTAIAACVVGFVGLGYDLIPFFGGALLVMAIARRRWVDLAIAAVTLALWLVFIGKGVPAIFGFPAVNSNTEVYGTVVHSWLDALDRTDGWGSLLLEVPRIFVSNFFFSGMVFFPALLLCLVAVRVRFQIKPVIGAVAGSILLVTLALFLFLNLAPPYDGFWQMRGTWLARLYQPVFVAVLLIVAATSVALRNTRRYKLFLWSVVVVAAIEALAIVGPYVHVNYLYRTVYENFYQDWSLRENDQWLEQLGIRPYGFCRT